MLDEHAREVTMLAIASAMICGKPRTQSNRLLLSAYDGVWDAVTTIPSELRPYVTDDLGNQEVEYGGFLQIRDIAIFPLIEKLDLFVCFRLVNPALIGPLKVDPPVDAYERLVPLLRHVGWDVFTGNGWRSASTDGLFDVDSANRFGLIDSKVECEALCKANDEAFDSWAPWNAVAVCLDESSYSRVSGLLT